MISPCVPWSSITYLFSWFAWRELSLHLVFIQSICIIQLSPMFHCRSWWLFNISLVFSIFILRPTFRLSLMRSSIILWRFPAYSLKQAVPSGSNWLREGAIGYCREVLITGPAYITYIGRTISVLVTFLAPYRLTFCSLYPNSKQVSCVPLKLPNPIWEAFTSETDSLKCRVWC